MKSDLRSLQLLLHRLIAASEGVAAGLAEERALPAGGLEVLIRGDQRLSAVARLDIYANMYFYRLLDVLKEDFPATLAVVGPQHFHNLVTGYLLEHPPAHPSVLYAGRFFADYIANHPNRERWPFLADLVRLERALIDVFVAPDATPLDEPAMRALPPEHWGGVRMRTHPALELLDLGWRAGEVARAVGEGREWTRPDPGPACYVVWRRRDNRARFREIDARERAALGRALTGASFDEICEAWSHGNAGPESAAPIAALLARWLADGVLVREP